MSDILVQPATQQAAAIRAGRISSEELLQATFARVDRLGPTINAVVWQDRDAALDMARACDAEARAGRFRGRLHGLPMTVKESFDIAGAPSTWGNPALRGNIASTDSDVVARYRAEGAIVYGKTNVPLNLVEWQSFNAVYGTTVNPWDHSRTPGGSSGGSAAALATGMSALEAGSDIGSSIRNPAHYCGVFGLKPTWNAVSMQGHKLPGNVGDTDIGVGGPMARSAVDLQMAFDIIAGPSRFDASQWSLALAPDRRDKLAQFTVALMPGDPASPVDRPYLDALDRFADALATAGATVIRDRLPAIDSEDHFTTYLRLLGAAMSMGMSDDDLAAVTEELHGTPEVTRRVRGERVAGMGISHREWLRLDNKRRHARLAFDAYFDTGVDLILAPVCASAAFERNEDGPRHSRYIPVNGADQLEMLQLFWSGYSGVVGLPSVVGPMDRLGGLPVGYQAIGGHGRDHTCLAFAKAVEREIGGYTPPPGLD